MNHQNKTQINHLVETAIKDGTFPCIEILMARGEELLFHEVWGKTERDSTSPQLKKNSLFDLASLTKPLATASAIMLLLESGALVLDENISRFFPEMSPTWNEITVRHLLTHTSGLPAWSQLYDKTMTGDAASGLHRLMQLGLESQPGSRMVYSCMGFILLGEIVRRVSKESLAEFCRKQLFTPLGLKRIGFNPPVGQLDLVPTQYCPVRKTLLRGIVHDENAYLFNGEGGNAGLFGTAGEVLVFCRMLLNRGEYRGERIFSARTVDLMWQNHNAAPVESRGLGWDYHSGKPGYSSCGNLMQAGSVGHLGFTGTSLWIEPSSKTIILLLSNRVHLSRETNLPLMRDFRPRIHNLLMSIFAET